MAVKIEKGGWVLIFLIGAGAGRLQPRSIWHCRFQQAAWAEVQRPRSARRWIPRSLWCCRRRRRTIQLTTRCACASTSGWAAPAAWWRTAGWTRHPGSIFGKKGLKVTFKIIDDWTEGAAALATNNVDVMLTTADV